MSPKIWLFCGAILSGLAVALGAYRAHALESKLRAETQNPPSQTEIEKRLSDWDVAVRYQMFQSVALLVVGILAERRGGRGLTIAGACLLLGTLLFTGPLYLLSFDKTSLHWAIIPSGGGLMILGWLVLAVSVLITKPAI